MDKHAPESRISFGPRVRKSPYFEATLRAGAQAFTIYNHTYMPTSYGDPLAEYHALVEGVTLWDVACQRQIEITGPDTLRLVQYLTPRNLAASAPGKCLYLLLTGPDGGIVNDAVMLHFTNGRVWLSPGDGDALLWVQAIALQGGFKVAVREPDVSPLQLQGPKSPQVARSLFGKAIDDLGYYRLVETQLESVPVVVSRTGWSGELGYEIYPLNDGHGEQIWNRIMETGKPWGIVPAAPSAIRSIEGGLLSYVSDITRKDNPYTLGMARLVDLDMEADFIGKDALRKIAKNGAGRRLAGIEISGAALAGNHEFWPVQKFGERVGHVTRCAFSPRLARNIGFANVPGRLAEIGTQLTIHTPSGLREAIVCEWPWMPAEKKVPV